MWAKARRRNIRRTGVIVLDKLWTFHVYDHGRGSIRDLKKEKSIKQVSRGVNELVRGSRISKQQ